MIYVTPPGSINRIFRERNITNSIIPQEQYRGFKIGFMANVSTMGQINRNLFVST